MSGQLARSLEVTRASTLSLSCVFWDLTLGVPAQAQRDRVVWNSYRLETTVTPSTGMVPAPQQQGCSRLYDQKRERPP